MELPIRFPTVQENVLEEVARFRALSADGQRVAIDDMFRLYHFLRSRGDHPEFANRTGEEDEARTRTAIRDAARNYDR